MRVDLTYNCYGLTPTIFEKIEKTHIVFTPVLAGVDCKVQDRENFLAETKCTLVVSTTLFSCGLTLG